MPSIYKTFTKEDVSNKVANSTDASKKTQALTIVSNFITYFKNKHLV